MAILKVAAIKFLLLLCLPSVSAALFHSVFSRFTLQRLPCLMAGSNHVDISDKLNRQIVSWCGVNGLLYTDGNLNWTPAPISLFPKKMKRDHFASLVRIQTIWNKLVDRIARDRSFLLKELEVVSHADPFTARLIKIFESLTEKQVQYSTQLAILRSDYMIDEQLDKPLQVEINTIASSFGSLSKRVNLFQQYLLKRNENDFEVQSLLRQVSSSCEGTPGLVAEHNSLRNIAAALAKAHEAFVKFSSIPYQDASILFIVQPKERNLADQRLLEQEIWLNHGISCEFITLKDISQRCRLDESRRLVLKHVRTGQEQVVSVAYFRAGYTPDDYPGEDEWSARELVENSAAVKCPSVGYHLAGCKAVQAALCKANTVERYLDEEESLLIRSCFAEQYSLGDPEIRDKIPAIIEAAIAEEGRSWVLKPQREGGGNNFYGLGLRDFLLKHRGQSVLDGFVLMRRIFPELEVTAFFKQGQAMIGPSLSELGIYGTCLSDGQHDLVNEYAGYLVRTKAEGVDEGGVATGYSVLNALSLV